ncbi:MAG: hypothetical protein JRG94_09960 [Deltaproteobacteria bacterium]|nr:hypothetical protein [Deltaproteobacteria bacterium]
MDFKERFLTAVNHREADRVPMMGTILDPATSCKILGRPVPNIAELLSGDDPKDELVATLNGSEVWNQSYLNTVSGNLESAATLGYDANWAVYSLMQLHRDPDTKVGWSWQDPFGRVWEICEDSAGNSIINYSRGLCPTPEAWEAKMEENRPLLDAMPNYARSFHSALVERFADRIYPVCYAAPGVFENCWQPMGFVEFTSLIYQDPDFMRRVVAFHTEHYLRHLDAVLDTGMEVVMGGDDLGQKTGPMLRPAMIEEFFGDSYRRIAERVHQRGAKLLWHSCGNIYALLEMFVDWGFDGIITMEPTADMEVGRVRELVGDKLVLIGNLDVSRLLVRGSQREVDEAVKQAIKGAASGGGFVLSASHSHSLIDPQRLEWMIEAGHRYGQYPLNL